MLYANPTAVLDEAPPSIATDTRWPWEGRPIFGALTAHKVAYREYVNSRQLENPREIDI
jgi:hypothetical protein